MVGESATRAQQAAYHFDLASKDLKSKKFEKDPSNSPLGTLNSYQVDVRAHALNNPNLISKGRARAENLRCLGHTENLGYLRGPKLNLQMGWRLFKNVQKVLLKIP